MKSFSSRVIVILSVLMIAAFILPAAVLADDYTQPDPASVAGKLIRDERIEAKKHMLEQYPALQAMYSAEDDNTEVLYFEDATATFASFGGAPKTVTF